MPHDVIRVGIVGYGFVAKTFHVPMVQATAGMELVAIASSRRDAVVADLPDVAVAGTPEALIAREDIDLIVLASPNQTHRPLAEAALTAGKHVLVDKPFMLTLEDARAVLATAERFGKMVSVFQNRRRDSDFLGIKQAIAMGHLGKVTHFDSRIIRFNPTPDTQWRETSGEGSGAWFDLAPHLVDQVVQLFGIPDDVSADLAALRAGASTDDWFEVVLRYPGRRVTLGGSLLAAGGVPRFTVHGEKGSVVKPMADLQEARFVAGMAPDASGVGTDPDSMVLFEGDADPSLLPTPDGDQLGFYTNLVRALRGKAANPVSPREALAVMAVIEAAVASAASGKVMTLDLTPDERAAWAGSAEIEVVRKSVR